MTGGSNLEVPDIIVSPHEPNPPSKIVVPGESVLERLEEILEKSVDLMRENVNLIKKLSGIEETQTSVGALRRLQSGDLIYRTSSNRHVGFANAGSKLSRVNRGQSDLGQCFETVARVDTEGCREYDTPVGNFLQQQHQHQSHNHEGRWGTTDHFETSFLHFSLFSTALWDLPNSRPVHSLMLSSHLYLCPPCLLPPSTVPCKMVLARPDERET